MAENLIKVIEDLEKKIGNFIEKDVEAIEEMADTKSAYSDKFLGDVLGKNDPYDDDNGDHEVHASESAVSDPERNAEWFPAVRGGGKTKSVAAPSAVDAKVDGKQDGDPGSAAMVGSKDAQPKGYDSQSSDAGSGDNDKAPRAMVGAKDAQPKGDDSQSSDAGRGDNDKAPRATVGSKNAQPKRYDSQSSDAGRGDKDKAPRATTGSEDAQKKRDDSASADAGRGDKDKAPRAMAGSKDAQPKGDDSASSDAGRGDNDKAARATVGAKDAQSKGYDSQADGNVDAFDKDSKADKASSADADSNGDNPADSHDSKDAAKSEGTASQADKRKKDSTKDGGANDPDTAAADEKFTDKPDPGIEKADSQEGSADTTFDRKAPSLVADLDDLAEKGKKAKMQKEMLQGVVRTLEEPHKLYKDPERLAIARSGDPDKIRHSLKRYGRSVEPKDDSDPKDISADPAKLADIRTNPNKAIRGMIDIGQQYGKDPFDGIDPADVQEIIEHHAAKHPHRKHNAPYVPPASAAGYEGSSDGASDNARGSASDRSDIKDDSASIKEDAAGSSSDDSSSDSSASDDSSAGGDEESPTYPKLDAAQDFDPDNPSDAEGLTPPSKKRKRSYPKPYSNNDDPNDLQLACDSLNEIAADAAGDEDDPSEDAPLHKKKAYAAKKMVKCLDRVRSFQQDPAACEGAFVDEASEEGAEIAGLRPDEIEQKYYELKDVSTRYKERTNPRIPDTYDDKDTTNANDDTSRTADEDGYVLRDDSDDGTHSVSAEETRYSSNVFINSGGDFEADETSDIEMSLPENQFPDTTVSTTTEDPDEDSTDSGEGSDPLSQVEGMVSGVLSDPDVSEVVGDVANVEGSVESIQGMVSNISKVKGELSQVESLGSKASSASSKIKGLKGAKSNFASMINLCSNPLDNLTQAENVLSGVGDLAQHPDAVINQAESLINAGQSGISALANAKNPLDALNLIGGMAAQLNGGGSSDDNSNDEDSDTSGADRALDYPDSSTGAVSDNTAGGADDDETTPAEFANADMYGDE